MNSITRQPLGSYTMEDMHPNSTHNHKGASSECMIQPDELQQGIAEEAAAYLRNLDVTVDFHDICNVHSGMFDRPRQLIKEKEDVTDPWVDLANLSTVEVTAEPEHLDISEPSLLFIQNSCQLYTEEEAAGFASQISNTLKAKSIRGLKLELPVLRSEHDIDLRSYNHTVWTAQELDLAQHNLPLEPCDRANDEGLDFPKSAYGRGKMVLKSVKDDRFEVGKETLRVLQNCLKPDWSEDDQTAMLQSHVNYQGLALREPLTPPLSPRLRTEEPFMPDEDVFNVPIPSMPSSATSRDLKNAEDKLFEDDNESWMSLSDIEELMNAQDAEASNLDLIKRQEQKMDDLKVDEPLLLPGKDDQVEVLPDLVGARDAILAIHQATEQVSLADFDGSVTDDIDEALNRQSAEKLWNSIEQEQLEPLDATIRVPVPVLDFQVLAADWETSCGKASAMFRHVRDTWEISCTGPKWTSKLASESEMRWTFWTTRSPNVLVEDPIEDDILLAKFTTITDDAHPPVAGDLVRKKSGLRVLEQDDDDYEELQPLGSASTPSKANWSVILAKRKNVTDEPAENDMSFGETYPDNEQTGPLPLDDIGGILAPYQNGRANTLLANYLELHASKKRKLENSKFFKKNAFRATRAPSPARLPPVREAALPVVVLQRVIPCPEITVTKKPPKFFVAVTLHRNMVGQLERLLPGAQLIDRDYNAHNAPIWLPGSVKRSDITSSVADEADLAVSPSTGIVLTTLLKVRQKPLPGGPGGSTLCNRVESLSTKYERLIVMVSEDSITDEHMARLSDGDATALAGFQAFAATLAAETTILYVSGGLATLAKWVAAIASRYASAAGDAREYLTEDETHWELFLRRAGMNVYAAQVVLGMLRGLPDEPVIDKERAFGLPAFVKMSEAARFEMFEGIMGGRRVLRRVGNALDAIWGGEQDHTKGRGDTGRLSS